jgi:hypothetical protein
LPVAGIEQKQQFSHVLSKQAYQSVADGHLWFSIFSRPPATSFTRVQRCTCCFVLLFTAMLFNILYYDRTQELPSSQNSNTGWSIGPLHITKQQIGIGVIIELLALIPSLLLVQFFRRIRPRHSAAQQLATIQQAIRQTRTTVPVSPSSSLSVVSTHKRTWHVSFPWWCLFIAYSVSLLIVGVCCLFIIARGIEFGDEKTQQWLISLVVGFISSVCLTQPLKVSHHAHRYTHLH